MLSNPWPGLLASCLTEDLVDAGALYLATRFNLLSDGDYPPIDLEHYEHLSSHMRGRQPERLSPCGDKQVYFLP